MGDSSDYDGCGYRYVCNDVLAASTAHAWLLFNSSCQQTLFTTANSRAELPTLAWPLSRTASTCPCLKRLSLLLPVRSGTIEAHTMLTNCREESCCPGGLPARENRGPEM